MKIFAFGLLFIIAIHFEPGLVGLWFLLYLVGWAAAQAIQRWLMK